MLILDLSECEVKKELNLYALEYIKNNPYFKARTVIRDFISLHLKISQKSREFIYLYKNLRYDLRALTNKLSEMGIIIPYNTKYYKINKEGFSKFLNLK